MRRIGTWVAGCIVLVFGAVGFLVASTPQSGGSGAPPADPIVISGAYVRPPFPPSRNAAAYFTVTNNTATADRLVSVTTGAGQRAVVHATVDGAMTVSPNGFVVPARGSLVLSAGQGHVMIENIFGTLKAGDNVNLSLQFDRAGTIDVNAPVIAAGAPLPSTAASSSTAHAH